jgi:hypothetical protein
MLLQRNAGRSEFIPVYDMAKQTTIHLVFYEERILMALYIFI